MDKKRMLMFSLFVVSLVFISGTVYAFSFSSVYSALFGPVLSVFDTPDTVAVINTAYLDKQKYMPGEQMIVTAAVSDVDYVTAYIETDVGVDVVSMVLVTGTKKEGTWQVAWTLHDTQTKEYFAKIVAVSESGIEVEKVLSWFDPIVSHSWNEITDIPAGFADGTDDGGGVWTESGSDIYYDGGNVGIGMTTPGDVKLNVSGNISITGFGNGVLFPDGSVQTSAVTSNSDWPLGSYCILSAGGCPVGFTSGFIYFDTEDNNNADRMSGSHGTSTMSGTGIVIYFCCK
ncbi:MAG: hypothetical protein GQ477_04180 [Nanohaloarchaea archaeon]|nr:hypothetical protein [Candidatus Nanohaloarchaea archaeon]